MQDFGLEGKTSIRELYPVFSGEELKDAERNLRRYFEIALEICSGQEMPRSTGTLVDKKPASHTMEERSNKSLKS